VTDQTEAWEYRAHSATLMTAGFWLLAGAAVATQGWLFGPLAAVRALPAALTAGGLAWTLFYRPSVRVDDDGVTVVNPFHRHTVAWGALIDVTTRYTCTLVTPHRSVEIFAAPGPSRQTVAAATMRDLRGHRTGHRAVPIGDLLAAPSGQVAQMVRRRWQEQVEAEQVPLGEAESTPVVTVLDRRLVTVLAIAAVVSVLALL
jgi:hypothetical protein